MTTFDLNLIGHANATLGPALSGDIVSTLSPSASWLSDQPPVFADPMSFGGTVVQHKGPQGHRHTFIVGDVIEERTLGFGLNASERSLVSYSSSDPNRTFQNFYSRLRAGTEFRLYKEDSPLGTSVDTLSSADLIGTYKMTSPLDKWSVERDSPVPTFEWEIEIAEHVA